MAKSFTRSIVDLCMVLLCIVYAYGWIIEIATR